MNRTLFVRSVLVALGVALLASPVCAQAYSVETVALNAALDARKTIDRVDGLARAAGRWGIGTDRWSSLMVSSSRLLRLAYKRTARFERAKISEVARSQIQTTKRLVLTTLRAMYDARVAVLEARGNARALRKAAAEIRRIDPALAKSILERARWVRAGGRGTRPPNSVLNGGRRYFNGRGAGRLTGDQLRWLGRRGYVPGRTAPPRTGRSTGGRSVPSRPVPGRAGGSSRPAPSRPVPRAPAR